MSEKTEPQNSDEISFIRGLPYYDSRTAKMIAFYLDNGGTKDVVMKTAKPREGALFDADTITKMTEVFVDFYLSNPVRAKELFLPYSIAEA